MQERHFPGNEKMQEIAFWHFDKIAPATALYSDATSGLVENNESWEGLDLSECTINQASVGYFITKSGYIRL